MFIRLVYVVAFLAIATQGADHNIILDCKRVSFCNTFRSKTPNENTTYKANLESLDIHGGVAKINLTNQDEDTLILQISALEGDKFRVTIEELDSRRYRLKDVLLEEPGVVKIKYSKVAYGELVLAESEVSKNRVVVQGNPFSIQFWKDDSIQLIIDGTKLIMEKNDQDEPFTLSMKFPNAQQIYGIHEHADALALRNTINSTSDPYRLRNLDVSGYELNSPMSLYGAIPLLYGHGSNGTSGIFLHNAAQQWYDLNENEVYIMVQSAMLDLFVLLGPKPKDVLKQYASLTGVSHMPQQWVLGYHQSRWNYDNQTDVEEVIANMDKNNFPMDVIWLDIEYTNGRRYFTWNPENFSNPVGMQKNISSTNRKLITIIDPHIKVDDDYKVYTGARDAKLFVKNSDGSDFQGVCWPGMSSYIDFLNPTARAYYAQWYSYENFIGSTEVLGGIWNDMNEPSVFDDALEKTLPMDALHIGNVKHRDIHNIYGLLHTMSTHLGLLTRDNATKRPFILTRSHFAGTQRYAAIWTGDNDATWGQLKVSYAQCLNANIMGIPFCGSDIGGFTNQPTEQLLQRWYQSAAWTPFYREHSTEFSARREPYVYPENVQNVIRNAMQLRYKHIPLWYTLFYEHTRYAEPVLRPLFYEYPEDEKVFKIDDQLFVGKDVMVRAVHEENATSVNLYLPGDDRTIWYSISNNKSYEGGHLRNIPVDINAIPVFYRGGSIIFRKDIPRRNTVEMKDDCYTAYVNLDVNGKAQGTIYLDDLTSFRYKNLKDYNYARANFEELDSKFTLRPIDDSKGKYNITLCDIVVYKPKSNEVIEGLFSQEIYTKNKQGKSLKDIKIKLWETIELEL